MFGELRYCRRHFTYIMLSSRHFHIFICIYEKRRRDYECYSFENLIALNIMCAEVIFCLVKVSKIDL